MIPVHTDDSDIHVGRTEIKEKDLPGTDMSKSWKHPCPCWTVPAWDEREVSDVPCGWVKQRSLGVCAKRRRGPIYNASIRW